MSFDPVSYAMGQQTGGDSSVVSITSATPALSSFMSGKGFDPPIRKLAVHVTAETAAALTSAFANLTGVEEIDLTVDSSVSSFQDAFKNNTVRAIHIEASTSGATSYKNAFANNLGEDFSVRVTGDPLDLSGVTSSSNLSNMLSDHIVEIRFVPNSCKYAWNISATKHVSNDTLVSIANALDGTAAGQTLTLHADSKAKCQTLMGTVAGGVFTANASGTVTLTDFITTTKGWTLA